jgi:hypothetical protein
MTAIPTAKAIAIGALINTVINAVINGIIAWNKLKDLGPLPITQNTIQGASPSVMGDAIHTALTLAMMFTAISYFTLKMPNKPPFFPRVLLLTVKHTLLAVGVLVTFGVLFQNYLGSIVVGPIMGSVIVGVVAGITAGGIDYLTKDALVASAR